MVRAAAAELLRQDRTENVGIVVRPRRNRRIRLDLAPARALGQIAQIGGLASERSDGRVHLEILRGGLRTIILLEKGDEVMSSTLHHTPTCIDRGIGYDAGMKEVLMQMKRFLVTYLAPASVIDEWKKTDPEKRRAAESEMQNDWKKWMSSNAGIFVDKGAGVGKTRRVTAQGSAAAKNEIMLYAIVQAESHEAASKMFEDHPHLRIPQSSIEIMEIHALPGTF